MGAELRSVSHGHPSPPPAVSGLTHSYRNWRASERMRVSVSSLAVGRAEGGWRRSPPGSRGCRSRSWFRASGAARDIPLSARPAGPGARNHRAPDPLASDQPLAPPAGVLERSVRSGGRIEPGLPRWTIRESGARSRARSRPVDRSARSVALVALRCERSRRPLRRRPVQDW